MALDFRTKIEGVTIMSAIYIEPDELELRVHRNMEAKTDDELAYIVQHPDEYNGFDYLIAMKQWELRTKG